MTRTSFTQPISVPATASAPLLDAERLDVYRIALEFQSHAAALAIRGDANIHDQLRRASLSCVLNTAEGAGQRSRPQKRHLYCIARGSAMECAAVLDVMRIRRLATAAECSAARLRLVRIIQMLTKLDRSLS